MSNDHVETYGFPPGYFIVRNLAMNRVLDVKEDQIEDGTEVILWSEKDTSLVETRRRPEANNQVFFVDASGALCSRSSGHALDIEGDQLVLRHRRPVSYPFPNKYAHPLPTFSFSQETGEIAVNFQTDPAYSQHSHSETWKKRTYLLTSIPLRKPKTIIDDATEFLSNAISTPLSFLSGKNPAPQATPDEVFRGPIDLDENEVVEEDRSEEAEVDDSPETGRKVPVTPFDNALAIDQIEVAYSTLLYRTPATSSKGKDTLSKNGLDHPRIISLGGDHTIVLPILRSLHKVYGPVSVIHFDAHLDTWKPGERYPDQTTEQSRVTHGTFFYLAQQEGLIANTSVHAGIRCKMGGPEDLEVDREVGFQLISADDIDDLGIAEVVKRIKDRVGTTPVYLRRVLYLLTLEIRLNYDYDNPSLDIDVVEDAGLAPGTGTPEAGGWTTRELKRILRGLAGLNFVGFDVVEVAPAYDHAEITGIAAADLVVDFLSMMLTEAPQSGTSGLQCENNVLKDEL
ncbi:hypothetical protein H0H92_014038 [Tricholoma furcatifolium]|nr:hypothetical protein H0H92_014038 [Tricholoma furcatifolium]